MVDVAAAGAALVALTPAPQGALQIVGVGPSPVSTITAIPALATSVLGRTTDSDPDGWWPYLLDGLVGNLIAAIVGASVTILIAVYIFRKTLRAEDNRARKLRARQASIATAGHLDRWTNAIMSLDLDDDPSADELARVTFEAVAAVTNTLPDLADSPVFEQAQEIRTNLLAWGKGLYGSHKGVPGTSSFEEALQIYTDLAQYMGRASGFLYRYAMDRLSPELAPQRSEKLKSYVERLMPESILD